jgi:hypothetical protein
VTGSTDGEGATSLIYVGQMAEIVIVSSESPRAESKERSKSPNC